MLDMNFGSPDWIVLSLMETVKKISEKLKLNLALLFPMPLTIWLLPTLKNDDSSLYLYNTEILSTLIEKLPPMQKILF